MKAATHSELCQAKQGTTHNTAHIMQKDEKIEYIYEFASELYDDGGYVIFDYDNEFGRTTAQKLALFKAETVDELYDEVRAFCLAQPAM
jgi:phosphoribosylaminoimidazole-succinocarboxamide synthase